MLKGSGGDKQDIGKLLGEILKCFYLIPTHQKLLTASAANTKMDVKITTVLITPDAIKHHRGEILILEF